ncbi:hypothetical protein [Treponema primitia]|uniref:hypothetical protein n=1 Tax=Treponema primitia TaxID=88058 RepID=UPI00025556A6|nr:hypothetical protein [Treponema primitia]
MKPKKYLFILFFVLWFSLPGLSFGETYFIDSSEVRTLRYLYSRAKKVFPFSAFPVHGSDLLDIAEKLPPLSSEQDQRLLDSLIAEFKNQQENNISLKGNLTASYVHRLRTASVLADDELVKNGMDFQRQYLSAPPILDLNAGIGTFTGIYVEGEIGLRKAWYDDYDPTNNFLFPAPDSELDINFDILNRGMLFWNGEHINVGLGRDKVHFGNTPGGTLYPSASLPYLDGLRISTPIGPFSMDYSLSTIQARRAKKLEGKNILNGGYNGYYYDAYKNFGFMMDENPTIILTATHRFQWNFGQIKTGLGGTVVYARSNNMFLMTDIIPIQIWHNADVRPNNLNMVLDASWALYPGLTLSGIVGFDDINANFIGINDSEVPTIPAGILQLEYNLLTPALKANFLFEAGATHFLWGNYGYDGEPDDGKPWGGVYLARAIYRYSPSNDGVLLPLTSPYGPGVYWGRVTSSFTISDIPSFEIGADLLLLTKIRGANLVTTGYSNDGVADESRYWFFSLDLPCAYTWKFLQFSFTPALLVNDGDIGFELNLGLRYKIQGKTYF